METSFSQPCTLPLNRGECFCIPNFTCENPPPTKWAGDELEMFQWYTIHISYIHTVHITLKYRLQYILTNNTYLYISVDTYSIRKKVKVMSPAFPQVKLYMKFKNVISVCTSQLLNISIVEVLSYLFSIR